jgi:glutathione S-transferase
MSALTLISFDVCPFVQRAAILLHEQGRPFDLTYIDLFDKPDWFLEISPTGKVPVLKVDETPLFESTVILEYLDETAPPEDRLLPADPLERARQRMWITFLGDVFGKGWQLQAAKDERIVRDRVAEVRELLGRLEAELPDDGPLWGGKTFTMVDAAAASILQRFTWAERLEPSLGLFTGLDRVQTWRDALLERASATASIKPDLEDRSARMLHGLGAWIARDVA